MALREAGMTGTSRQDGGEPGTGESPERPSGAARPAVSATPASRKSNARQAAIRMTAILFVAAITGAIFLFGNRLVGLGAYGYPGVFLITLISSSTVILPAPGLAFAFAAGANLNPFLVGICAGLGATLGELTGYLAGVGGRGFVEGDAQYERMHGWMARYGLWVIFVLSIVPNPIFDVAGITAGAMKIPVLKFLCAALPGQIIKATLVALAGAGMMDALTPFIQRFFLR
jgi:membrane protein DedA with SNARE-associated domain